MGKVIDKTETDRIVELRNKFALTPEEKEELEKNPPIKNDTDLFIVKEHFVDMVGNEFFPGEMKPSSIYDLYQYKRCVQVLSRAECFSNSGKVSELPLYNTLLKKDKILFMLFDFPGSTKKQLEELIGCSIEYRELRLLMDYGKNHQIDHNPSTKSMALSRSAIDYVTQKVKNYIDNIKQSNERLEKKKENEIAEEKRKQQIVEYFSTRQPFNVGMGFVTIDFNLLEEYDSDLGRYLLDNPDNFLEDLKVWVLQDEPEEDIDNFRFLVKNLPESLNGNVNSIKASDIGKIVSVTGEISSRGSPGLVVKKTLFECPSCKATISILQDEEDMKEPGKCQLCGRKGKWKVKDQQIADLIKISLADLRENLGIDQVPEEIPLYIENDHFDTSTLYEGMKIKASGVLRVKNIKTEKKSIEKYKEIFVMDIERLSPNFSNVIITEEDEQQLIKINGSPLEYYKSKVFPDIYGADLGKELGILTLFAPNLNLLFCGDPGTGKSEISKRVCNVGLRAGFIDIVNATRSGLIGTVTKNEHTGKYVLDMGGLRKLHPNGVAVLDEIQRNPEIQDVFLGILQNKKININKANNRADYDCDISVIGTANPIKDDKFPSFSINAEYFGLSGALFDRISFKVFFNTIKMDAALIKSTLVNKKYKIEEKDYDLIKKHQLKAREIVVKFNDEDYENLSILGNGFFNHLNEKVSFRGINHIQSLLIGLCKIHNRSYTTKEDYQKLSDIFLALQNSKEEYEMNMGGKTK